MSKLIMKSLPLVASALGRKYGVRVNIGGSKACTDGNTIHLPSLPLDDGVTLVCLARGYLDHEAAHIRETRFDLLKDAKLSPLEKHVMNIFEDWRVEHCLARIFPGCRQNFNWLIRHLFAHDGPLSCPPEVILDWLLFSVRAWDVPAIGKRQATVQQVMNQAYPGLSNRLNMVLQKVKRDCKSTQDAIDLAREVVAVIAAVCSALPEQKSTALNHLLQAESTELPRGFGEELAGILESASPKDSDHVLQVAQVGRHMLAPISAAELQASRHASRALLTKLQGVLQAKQLQMVRLGRHGRLDAGQLYRLPVHDGRVFRRQGEVPAMNTAVHLLVDSSGSMRKHIDLVSQVCHVVATGLAGIKGINLGVTTFPSGTPKGSAGSGSFLPTVFPVLEHGQQVHDLFQLVASGRTPFAEALWWVLQQMQPLPQSRKIILILTDGEPDSYRAAKAALEDAHRFGFEVLGLGLESEAISRLLPGASQTITSLADIAPAMFGLLQSTLLKFQ